MPRFASSQEFTAKPWQTLTSLQRLLISTQPQKKLWAGFVVAEVQAGMIGTQSIAPFLTYAQL